MRLFLLCFISFTLAAEAHQKEWTNSNIRIDGETIFAETRNGNGPTLILMKGLGSPLSTWNTLVSQLDTQYNLVRYSRFGIEPSTGDNAGLNANDHIRHLKLLIDHVSPDQPVILLAHSLASIHARMFASHYPNRVQGMVLIDPTPEMLMYKIGLTEEMIKAGIEQNIKGVANMGPAAQNEMRQQYVDEKRLADVQYDDVPVVVISSFQLPPEGMAESWGVDQHTVDMTFMQKLAIQSAMLSNKGLNLVTMKSGHNIHINEPRLILYGIEWIKTQH